MEEIPFLKDLPAMWEALQLLEPYIEELMQKAADNYNVSMLILSIIYFWSPFIVALVTFNRNWLLIMAATPICWIPIVGWPFLMCCALFMRGNYDEGEE